MPSRSPPPAAEKPKNADARDWTSALREAAPLLGLGTTLAVTVLAAVGLGYWLDARLGTRPWLLLVCGLLGVGAALYEMIRTVAQDSNRRSGPKH